MTISTLKVRKDSIMEIAKIKVLKKKPLVYIDRNWFPFRDIINTDEFDYGICQTIEEEIRFNGKRKVIAYYDIVECDDENRPTKILVGCKVKGKPYDWSKYLFNTIYDKKPLSYQITFGMDPNIDPFIYKRFMSAEDYIDEGDE